MHTKLWSDLKGRLRHRSYYKVWTGFICLRTGPVAASCEHHNEPSGYIIGGEFD